MKKHTVMALSTTITAAVHLPAFAQNQASSSAMEEVVITSSALQKNKAETALPITVISGEALHQSASQTLGETLATTPGIANASFGPSVGQPIIRGQQGNRVRILQNSTGNLDASSSGPDHAVTIEPLLADAIEVLRGPSTLLYGGGAIGGVVNIIDNRIPSEASDGVVGAFEQRFDSASSGSTSIFKLDGGSEKWAWHLDGVYRDWDDIKIPVAADEHSEDTLNEENSIHNSGGRTKNFTAGLSRLFDNGHIGLSISQLNNTYGIPEGGHHHEDHDDPSSPDTHEEEENVWIDLSQSRYDIAGSLRLEHNWLQQLNWHLTYTDYEHTEYENSEAATDYTSQSLENRLELSHSFSDQWQGAWGVQNQWREFQALAGHDDHDAAEPEHEFDALIPQTEHLANGLFFVESVSLHQWIHEFGGRVDVDQYDSESTSAEDKNFTSLSASASSIWQWHEQWSSSIALSHSERAPSIDELYSNVEGHEIVHGATGTIQLGNQNLDTETANNIDLSLRWNFDSVSGEITAFYNDFNDYIYLLKTGHTDEHIDIYSYTQQDAVFKGLEISSDFSLSQNALWGYWDLNIFADSIDGENADGSTVPRLPPYRIGSTLNFHKNAWASFIRITHAADQNDPGTNEESTEGYNRWDMEVNYTLTARSLDSLLFCRVNNLTDAEIRNATSFLREVAPEAGRSVVLGARITF